MFEENVLDATKKYENVITDKKDIEGLPATALGLAAQTAVTKVNCLERGITYDIIILVHLLLGMALLIIL